MHKFGTFNISLSTYDFSFRESLSFRSHWKISLKLFWKCHIFNENLFNENSPFIDFLINKLLNGVWYGLSFFKKILKCIFSTNCSECGISYFCNWLHDTLNSIISHFGVDDSIIYTGVNIYSNVIFGKYQLTIEINDSENDNKFLYIVFRFTVWMTSVQGLIECSPGYNYSVNLPKRSLRPINPWRTYL